MVKTYLIAFSSKIKVDELANYLGALPENEFWFYNMANSIFVNTEVSAQELSKKIKEKYGDLAHIVIKITDNEFAGQIEKDHIQHIIR